MQENKLKLYAVTGTFHGAIVQAKSEGDARRLFHSEHKGESITHVKLLTPKHRLTNL